MAIIPKGIKIIINDITPKNQKRKFVEVTSRLAKALNIPHSIVKAKKEHVSEPYFYKIQEELSERWKNYYNIILKTVYKGIVEALELPLVEIETIKKAVDDGLLRYAKWGVFGKILSVFGYKGNLLYSPETGEPLQKKEYSQLIDAITKFLNAKSEDTGERMVRESVVAGKLLRRMAKYNAIKEMENLTLDNLRYRGKSFDWITDSTKNVRNTLGEDLSRWEQARYQVAQEWAAHKVTNINNKIKDEIVDTILGGIKEHRSKSQVSQDLFNRLGGLNRDWKRIADTEIVNTSNLAGIMEEVHKRSDDEKVYFKRYELPGCCDKCAKINGLIALWSNVPLADERIKDPYAKIAIWEGKDQGKGLGTGVLHPNCRGGWTPWGDDEADAMVAKLENKSDKWNEAVGKAREEYRNNGIETPNDLTPGYIDRINELYQKRAGE